MKSQLKVQFKSAGNFTLGWFVHCSGPSTIVHRLARLSHVDPTLVEGKQDLLEGGKHLIKNC